MQATLAVILARGLGTRLRADEGVALTDNQREVAAAGAKGLMPIAGRPFLDYVLHELAEAGVHDVVFVIAPDDDRIRQRYDDEAPPTRLRVRYAVQDEPRGTAHALLAARDAVRAPIGAPRDDVGARHFLMCNADNLYPAVAVRSLVTLDGPGLVAFDAAALTESGVVEPDRINRFALLDIAANGALADIVEKPSPDHPLARTAERLVSMNLWRFTDAIFDDCAAVAPSPRGELELVDAVRTAMARGTRFAAVRQRVLVPDLTHRRDVAALESLLRGWTPSP
jgi:dTDP-glucose pyrophosphorylase